MSFFFAALAGGFAGSFHCVGMCGGFACGLAQMNTGSRLALLRKNVLYNSGRLLSYVFIGALAGALGASLIAGHHSETGIGTGAGAIPDDVQAFGMVMSVELGVGQRLLSVVAGVLMIAMALQLLGFRRHIAVSWGRLGGVGIARAMQSLIRSDRPGASVSLGVANGFLPCPLVFAFAAIAAASANAGHGMVTMLGFGLGTFPAMFLMSGVGLALSPVLRQRGVRVAGGFVLVMGLLTIARGVLPAMMHGASHSMPM